MQNRRGVLFLVLAVMAGISAVLIARSWLARQTADVIAVVETRKVVVAAADLEAGVKLHPRQLDLVDWPRDHLPRGVIGDKTDVTERVAKRALAAGEPVLESLLLPIGADAGLHAMIRINRRAVSVKVDAVIGVAGWVKPGSRVDVLATLRRIDWDRPLPFTRAILQDVRVLAIDQNLEKADAGSAEIVSVVTLEVTPRQAQHLAYAAAEGSLQLALRNPEDSKRVEARSTHAGDLIPVGIGAQSELPTRSGSRTPAAIARIAREKVETVRGVSVGETLL